MKSYPLNLGTDLKCRKIYYFVVEIWQAAGWNNAIWLPLIVIRMLMSNQISRNMYGLAGQHDQRPPRNLNVAAICCSAFNEFENCGSETRSVSAQRVLETCIPMQLFTPEFANWNRERKCADTINTVPVPWAGHSNAKILMYFQIKYSEAILSNSTRKLLWFEITKMLVAV